MKLANRLVIILLLILTAIVGEESYGARRTSKDVRRDKQKTEKQIAQTKKQIAENDRETSRQLSRLQSIKADIALRGDTIGIIRARLDSVNTAIEKLNDSILVLESRQEALKANYGRTLRTIRSRRQGMSDLSFVFSSKSFSQAWRRIRYLRQIAKTATKQAKQLEYAKDHLAEARAALTELRRQQAADLEKQNVIQTTLRTEQASADNIIKDLKKQGKSLQRELDKRNRQAQALNRELDKIVEEEIRQAEERKRKEAEERKRKEAEEQRRRETEEKKRREAEEKKQREQGSTKTKPSDQTTAPSQPKDQQKPKAPAENTSTPSKTFDSEAEAERRLTGSFASNKGRLLFPVAGRYTIVSNFGTNELPELSKIKVDNLGIDIEVPGGTMARSVFEGVVSSIFRLDGYNNIVIVRHGEYLSVYAGIDALSVKKGDKVKAGQHLGTVFTVPGDERPRLHFEIRHEKQKLNPTEWVK